MSAWIVTDAHINYMLTFMLTRREDRMRTRRLDHLANVLRAANYASCNARYRNEYGEAPETGFQVYRGPVPLDPVTVLKQCDCFDYQACEVSHYERTEAAGIVNEIRSAAISALPGWDAAPWGIDKWTS